MSCNLSSHHAQSLVMRPMALAVQITLAASLFSSAGWMPLVYAQTSAASSVQAQTEVVRHYDLPAGPLSTTLTRFSSEAGIFLVGATDLVQGKTSPGVQGRFSVQQALKQLLAGTGLTAQPNEQGHFVLQAAADVIMLPSIRVVGITEGTGSYTTNLTNTATKLDLSLRETPQSVTVITRQRIEDQGLDEISKVLDQTNGLYLHHVNVVGGDDNPIYSRGFPLDNYQVNGVPRSTRFGFKNDIADTAVFDRVEVVRGASGLLNGIGEPAGAVNLVRKLPTEEFQAHVAAGYGSWNHHRVEADMSGALIASGRIRGRLVGAYQESDSFVDRLQNKKDVLYGVIEADLTPATYLTAGLEYQNHKTTGASAAFSGSPLFFQDGSRTPFSHSTNLSADWAGTSRENLTLFANLEHYFDNDWRVKLDLEQVRREYNLVVAAVQSWGVQPDGTGNFDARRWHGKPEQNSLNLHATGPFSLFGRDHELVVGGSYDQMKEKNWDYKGAYISDTNFLPILETGYYPRVDMSPTGTSSETGDWQSGAYAAARLNPADKWHVILGSRLSNWKTRTDSYDAAGMKTRGQTSEESAVITPYAGIVLDLTESLSLYTSYTDIFQPATYYDANGELLSPAEGSNIEAGIKLALHDNQLNLSAAWYRTKKDNVPEYVPGPGGAVNYGPTGRYVYQGIDGTKTTGFEFEVSGLLTPDWQASGGYSFNDLRDANNDKRLTHLPTRTFKLFTRYRTTEWLPNLILGGNLRWQNQVYTSEYRQGSLAIIDLMVQYEISRNITSTLNVNNLFDKNYLTDIYNNGWYGEPRSAYLNLKYTF